MEKKKFKEGDLLWFECPTPHLAPHRAIPSQLVVYSEPYNTNHIVIPTKSKVSCFQTEGFTLKTPTRAQEVLYVQSR